MTTLQPLVPSQYRGIAVARVFGFAILRLQQVPVTLFGLVEMMTGIACETTVVSVQSIAATTDRTSKWKCLQESDAGSLPSIQGPPYFM